MNRVEIRIRNDAGDLISDREYDLDMGSGRFDEIEDALEQLRQQALKELAGDLCEQAQSEFIEQVKKTAPTD